ncbi:hypothetical protein EcWSU1_01801 [Enterobacter ludwigii]|uniref:Uncharacterized protein n=1 Tax=Enterobacter ludwigii TaxID=299767 RepID=G8LKK7_9ENTR|nr:hypothetical protein EcWSU1_01801 [Enterobacter ludwigii]
MKRCFVFEAGSLTLPERGGLLAAQVLRRQLNQ